jgi:hypothetical protein
MIESVNGARHRKRRERCRLVATVFVGSLLVGCRSGPERPGGDQPPVSLVSEALDTNKDGVIDASEIANAPRALLTLDKNGDGQLSYDEVHRADVRQPPGDPPPLIAVLDVNRDDVIDSNEIAGAAAALKTLDKNGDGQLNQTEILPPPVVPRSGAFGDRPRVVYPGR